MLDSDEHTLSASVTTNKARLLAALMLAAGIFFAILGDWIDKGIWKAIAEAMASTTLSLGLLSLLYDLGLKRELQTEILKLVRIERSLSRNAIIAAGRPSDVPWGRLLAHKTDLKCLLIEPLTWIDSNWQVIADSAQQRKIQVSFLVPDPQAPYIGELAAFVGYNSERLQASIQQSIDMVETRWRDLVLRGRIATGSKIDVKYITNMPCYSFVIADNHAIISVLDATGKRGSDLGFSLVFHGALDTYPLSWLSHQINTTSGAAAYSNEVA